jgi:hypothetical protein
MRLVALVVLASVLVVFDVGVVDAARVPETLSEKRPAGAGVIMVEFPIDFVAVSWDASDVDVERHHGGGVGVESHGAVRFRHDGRWGGWVPLREDGVQAPGRWSSALVVADDAEAYQVRGIPGWARSANVIAINTTDGPLVTVGERRRGGADALSSCVSRAEWGADESKRLVDGVESWPTTFYPVQGLIVHHTVTANDDPDPAATVRAIYEHHTVGNGWGDIGYNYLVDESGVVYEGRWSGAASVACSSGGDGFDFAHDDANRLVTGGHTAYHNQGNVGVAVLGNFASAAEYPQDPPWVQVDPKPAAVAAVTELLAELAMRHRLDPGGMVDYANPMCDLPSDEWEWDCDDLSLPYFPGRGDPARFKDAIAGHRDWRSTACPGALLYALLGSMRDGVASLIERRPVITVEQDPLTLEGNTKGGYAGVISGVSATDPDDEPVTLANNAPGVLPVGDTVVVWKATDPGGRFDVTNQTVTIVDTTPPDATPPDETVVDAANKLGGVADFTVTSTDVVDPSPVTMCTPASGSVFPIGVTSVSCVTSDASGNETPTVFAVTVVANAHTFGLIDPISGLWHLYDSVGIETTSFYFGNPGDYPIMGDWDGDGVETPGLYRQSDGYVYLRNSNTQGIADIRFFFGNPGDVPIAGDFNGDGFDTVSIYRPSEARFYIVNELGANDGGLGAADIDYVFGNPGDKPFVGDFNTDGIETVGLHRETTGLVYFRNSHTQGNADNQFIFGDPGDRLVAGDWTGNGEYTAALFRPSNTTAYFRYTNTQGNANSQFTTGQSPWLPVAGNTGTR